MKKSYKTIKTFVVLLCLMAAQMGAQLNGVVTINNTQPSSATNFTSFTAFASALATQGVSGPVTANVGGTGPYTEQPLFTQVVGASTANRITINGNNYLLTFSSSNTALKHTMGFNGADYITVNGLRMEGTGSYAYVAHFYNNANYNTFNNCTFSVTANTTNSEHIPVCISGSPSSYSSFGTGGNFNVFNGCTMFSGYWGISIYGNTASPYLQGNEFNDCSIRDFYVYGVYLYAYTTGHKFRNNNISCPTRTNNTTKYGVYTYGTQDLLMDGNWIHDLFAPSLISTTSQCFGMYIYYNLMSSYMYLVLPSTAPNIIRNNIVSDIKHNGTVYGIYAYAFDGDIYNNTVSLDYAGATGGTTYGIYGYGYPANYVYRCINNIVTITRGGTGTKYCYYSGAGISNATDLTCDRNDFYIAASGSNNYVGFYTTNATNLAALQSQGANSTGFSVDPAYTSMGTNYIPTNASINNQAIPKGLVLDQQKSPRSGTTPDIGALEFLSSPCSGTPTPGSVVVPPYILCPGETADLILSNFSSDLGITYQWGTSTTSSVGPFVPIPTATSVLWSSPNMTASAWFQVVVTCTNSNQFVTPVGFVNVVGTSYSTVPYYEDFESIAKTNKLPNCSWFAPTIGGQAFTYTSSNTSNRVANSGSKFASFYYNPGSTQNFWTNAIWMDAGVTYSASVWYTTEYYGYNNWTNFSILVGPNQNTTGQQVVANVGPAISNTYKALSNTYQVSSSGWYYVNIRAQGTTNSSAQYLSWDDLRIEIPCSLNTPSMSVSSSTNVVCANGGSVVLNATGVGPYSFAWSTGDLGQTAVVFPTAVGFHTYSVTGTNTITGCKQTLSRNVTVNPSPNLNVFANPPTVCAGSPVNLHALGAQTYYWSNNATGNVITVVPTQAGTYSVQGTNQYNCSAMDVVQVNVNPKPSINATASQAMICAGETHAVTGFGGVSYQIVSPSSYHTTNPAMVTPMTSTQYTVSGVDNNGCAGIAYVTIQVDACTGMRENSASGLLKVYPNPTNGMFTVELGNGAESVEVVDVTGRVIIAEKVTTNKVELNISNLSNGVYSVKVKTEGAVEAIRVIKN